jgi:hypothetical protein
VRCPRTASAFGRWFELEELGEHPIVEQLDPDAATFRRNGSRKPHTYY